MEGAAILDELHWCLAELVIDGLGDSEAADAIRDEIERLNDPHERPPVEPY